MTEPAGTVFRIQRFSIHDGPGIRTTVFLQGCPLRCRWCHNPEGIPSQGDRMKFYESVPCSRHQPIRCNLPLILAARPGLLRGKCRNRSRRVPGNRPAFESATGYTGSSAASARAMHTYEFWITARKTVQRGVNNFMRWPCIPSVESGRMSRDVSVFTPESLADELEKDTPFFDRSGGGVTFSGGEPLLQPAFLVQTLEELQQREIHTCVDTSGFAPAETLETIIPLCDTFLFDLKLIDESEHREYTGVSAAPVLESLKLLLSRGADINIRIPLIPGITDTGKNIDGILDFLVQLKSVRRVNILPFHGTGEGKYEKLGLENPMKGVAPPCEEKVQRVKAKFENSGFNVSVGG